MSTSVSLIVFPALCLGLTFSGLIFDSLFQAHPFFSVLSPTPHLPSRPLSLTSLAFHVPLTLYLSTFIFARLFLAASAPGLTHSFSGLSISLSLVFSLPPVSCASGCFLCLFLSLPLLVSLCLSLYHLLFFCLFLSILLSIPEPVSASLSPAFSHPISSPPPPSPHSPSSSTRH